MRTYLAAVSLLTGTEACGIVEIKNPGAGRNTQGDPPRVAMREGSDSRAGSRRSINPLGTITRWAAPLRRGASSARGSETD